MSKLTNFYDTYDVAEDERIKIVKDILLIVPEKGFDLKDTLAQLGLSAFEVSVTWPKNNVDLLSEVLVCEAKHVFQVGCNVSRRFPRLDSEDHKHLIPDKKELIKKLPDAFVNLHHHDEFSIRDGLGQVSQLTKLLTAQKRSFCAVTNHGSLGGWIKQYNACKKAGIKAIFGGEMYVSQYRGDDPKERAKNRSAYHLVLLAATEEGFYNLIRIHNDAQLEGFYYSPRCNDEALKRWGRGIIATSACLGGELASLLMEDKIEEAKERYEFYNSVFDEFYIELTFIEFAMQVEVNKKLLDFAREVGAPIVITNDSHYLEAEHNETHNLLMLIREGKTRLDAIEKPEEVWQFEIKNLFYRNTEQVYKLWEEGFEVEEDDGTWKRYKYSDIMSEDDFWEAVLNTHKIAVKCENIELDSTIKLPKLSDDSESKLRENALKGMVSRGLNSEEYKERLEFELKVISDLGWCDYYLIVEDFVKYALDTFGEWAVGFGRGSGSGSLVSYCIGITDIDPIEHGLLFERFLDYSRPDPPDFDLDFDPRYREPVKKYVVEKYGQEHTCSIGTYQTWKTKAVILDVARVLGYDVHEANAVTREMDGLASFSIENNVGDAEEIQIDKMSLDEVMRHYPKLEEYFEKYPEVAIHAEVLRNQVKNMSTHAGGVIISDLNLQGRIPVVRDKKGMIVSAWAESGNSTELSSVGLVKFDLLGLSALTIISDCIDLIEKNRGEKLRRSELPIDDRIAIRQSAHDDLVGIFQLENPATKSIADKFKLDSLADITVLTSLIRPGPAEMGMDLEYAERKNEGKEYDMPQFMKELLQETYGVIAYQEQCMTISKELSGFTGPEANRLRKAIGKKKADLMEEMKAKFIDGAKERIERGDITESEVTKVYELIETFAGYGFNKCLTLDMIVETTDGYKCLGEIRVGEKVRNHKGDFVDVVDVIDTGKQEVFEVETDSGNIIKCTLNHKFLCEDGEIRPLWDILFRGCRIVEE